MIALQDDSSKVIVERVSYDDFGKPLFECTDSEAFNHGSTRSDRSFYNNPFAFNGQRWEGDLELYDYRFRWFDPSTGRFITRDPIGIWGDPGNLGNGYTYTGNNPWSNVDPYGLEACPRIVGHHVIPLQQAADLGYGDLLDNLINDKQNILNIPHDIHGQVHQSSNDFFPEFVAIREDANKGPLTLDDFKDYIRIESDRIKNAFPDHLDNINFSLIDYKDKSRWDDYNSKARKQLAEESHKKRMDLLGKDIPINDLKLLTKKHSKRKIFRRILKGVPGDAILFGAIAVAGGASIEEATEQGVYDEFFVDEAGMLLDYGISGIENWEVGTSLSSNQKRLECVSDALKN